ncbi:type I restriction endonuclease subunit S [Tenacibaculum sp. KUL113]|nr:type I restriction endonuclease subunit S [Tenacibaculum sp. KUL113]
MVDVENKIQRYDSYKDSGVSWLEAIPKHWELKRFKHLFKEKKITHNVDLKCGSISFGKVVYKDDEKIPVSTKKSYQVLNKGEFLINPLNLNYDLKSLRIGLSDKDVVVSSGYIIVQNTTEISKDYYKWLLHIFDVAYMKTLGSGVRQTLSFTHIANSELVFPPLPEQTTIAQFLDDKTTKIDQAIAIKQQQIALLKERKQIFIHKAVTRGLNDSVALKDSGVDWIGEIPEHWEVKPIKYLGKIINGYAFNSGEFKDEGVRVLKISNIQTMRIDWTDESFIYEKYYNSLPQFVINENDLVFALTRPIISTGIKASIVDSNEKILLNQRNAVLKPSKILFKKWIYFIILDSLFTQTFDREIDKTGQQPNISTYSIGNIKIPLPSFKEQKEIAHYIETASAKIETTISLKEQEIEKLQEYKSSLINSVVTGKVRVC